MRVDGAVGARPVNGQTQGGEEVFEDLLVFNRELFTEFNEVVAGDTRPLCLAAVGLGGAVCLPGDQVTGAGVSSALGVSGAGVTGAGVSLFLGASGEVDSVTLKEERATSFWSA